jgi:hypothetical protein
MPARGEFHESSEVALVQVRDQVTAILVCGLVRLVGVGPRPRAPTSMPAANLSESAESGLELPRETRLRVPAG